MSAKMRVSYPSFLSGRDVHEYISAGAFPTLTYSEKKLARLPHIARVIVVGSSACGKSTLERCVRDAAKHCAVAERVVTRAPRADDVAVRCVSVPEFQRMAKEGCFGLHGKKYMEHGREEFYGFLLPEKGFPVYFANNGVVKNPELVSPCFQDDSLVVAISAPEEDRMARVRRRSPHFFTPEYAHELAFRFSGEESSESIAEHAHAIIDNSIQNEHLAPADLSELLSFVSTPSTSRASLVHVR